jgi:very-short-patch-repair endonuclease
MSLTALTGAVLTTNRRSKILINRGYRILRTVNAKVNGRSTVTRALTER